MSRPRQPIGDVLELAVADASFALDAHRAKTLDAETMEAAAKALLAAAHRLQRELKGTEA